MDELIHKGHRQRMRSRLKRFGPEVFDTYELLEMLLYYTVPVKDTNPLAKKLLTRFGSLDGVLSAAVEELKTVDGIGEKSAELINRVGMALEISKTHDEDGNESPRTYEDFGELLTDYLRGRRDNVTVLVSLDNKMRILGIDEVYPLDCSSAGVRPKAFIDASIRRSSSVAIIAHNHPYGTVIPSEADRMTNTLLASALGNLGIDVAEHYIIAGDRYLGFMNHIKRAFAQKPALEEFFESKRRCVHE